MESIPLWARLLGAAAIALLLYFVRRPTKNASPRPRRVPARRARDEERVLTMEEFRDRVADRLRENPDRTVSLGAEPHHIVIEAPGRPPRNVTVSNAYQAYLDDPEQVDAAMADLLASAKEMEERGPAAG